MSKVIFIDVDGTLLDYENNLPSSADKAIKEARKNGHKVYICTGRSKAEVYPYLWDIGLDGMIGGNGSYVEDHNNVVMHQLITKEQCCHIVDWLQERKLEFYLESNNGLFASENFEKRGNPVIKEYCRRKGKDNADNLTVKDITKAHAIDCLLKYLGISIEDTIAFGDAKIDIPMLEYCNIGVAMGSGGEEIKAMADYVTDDVDNDGLYKAFVHFGLIEK